MPRLVMLDLFLTVNNAPLPLQILINAIIVVKDLQAQPGQYSPTLLVAAILQVSYATSPDVPLLCHDTFALLSCLFSL